MFGVNSLWPSDTIWRHKSGLTLAQIMACCLTALNHYLNQCWLIISGSSGIHLRAILQEIHHISHQSLKLTWKLFIQNLIKSPRGQWVNHHSISYSTHSALIADIPDFISWYRISSNLAGNAWTYWSLDKMAAILHSKSKTHHPTWRQCYRG